MSDLIDFAEVGSAGADAVGGKGLSLGQMTRAGLPVPPGFCVVSSAHRRLRGRSPTDDAALAAAIAARYQHLGGGLVAVRSSATAEDGSAASFAGQQETFLGVEGDRAVLDAVGRCWASLDSERAVAYRRKQGVADDGLSMAVVVQRLVPAEVAGVLFTLDPLDADGQRMLVEASWGLGEAVVSGRVTPDRFGVTRDGGQIVSQQIATKTIQITGGGEGPVPPEKQTIPCLSETQLAQLADLGRRVEAFLGGPRDVEWAFADGRFWLLQARPITTASAFEREQVRRAEIAALEARAAAGGTVWARFNLAETLPEPTPLTWAVVSFFMSGKGGFGATYRDLGYEPDPALDDDGVYDLICGRPYCNLSREPLLYARGRPLGHDFASLKAAPREALYPKARPLAAKTGWKTRLLAPLAAWHAFRHELSLQDACRTFAPKLRGEILPAFVARTEAAAREDWSGLDVLALLDRFEFWWKGTLRDFARDSLKATVLAAVAMGKLEYLLTRSLGSERARAAVGELVMGVRPDADADLPGAVRDLAAGQIDRATFLARFGHRGPHEMELAYPRWSEDASSLDRLAGSPVATASAVDPNAAWERVAAEAKLSSVVRGLIAPERQAILDFLGLREAGKNALMRGYALIRRALVLLDTRFRLSGGIFFLTPGDELQRLTRGEDLSKRIEERQRRRRAALSLDVPPVLFSDDLEAIGRPPTTEGGDVLHGVPLSAGSAEAAALVLQEPTGDLPAEGYVLVCPSTDPAWVPLFVRAKALVMETGGVLSHGAIVAREFGLPAVAGIAGAMRHLKTGQRLRVDGAAGTVTLLDGKKESALAPQ